MLRRQRGKAAIFLYPMTLPCGPCRSVSQSLSVLILLSAAMLLANEETSRHGEKRFSVSESLSELHAQSPNPPEVRKQACGLDCAYLMLRLHGWKSTYPEVEKRIAVGPHGSSLADMQTAMCELGLPVCSVSCVPEDLRRLPLPAVALMEEEIGATRHFVVVTSVNEREVVFLEPNGLSEQSIPRAQFSQLSTGCYLAVAEARFLGLPKSTVAFWLGVSIIVVSLVLFLRSRRRPRFPSTSVMAMLGISFVLLGSGCTPTASDVSGSHGRNAIQVSRDFVQLDVIQLGTNVEYKFPFRNVSHSPLNVQLGRPSCGCLRADLIPQGGQIPVEGEGAITLVLRATERDDAGLLEAKVPLFVSGSHEVHLFGLRALVEGFAHYHQPYVIRPSHLKSRTFPPIKFLIFTREQDTPFELLGISSHAAPSHWLAPSSPQAQSPPTMFVGQGPAIKSLDLQIDKASFGDPQPYRGVLFVREILVPVSVSGEVVSIDGHLAITYRIRHEPSRVGKVDVLMLAGKETQDQDW